MSYNFTQVGLEISYHLNRLMEGIAPKLGLAIAPAAVLTHLHINAYALYVWLFFMFLDLVLGVVWAISVDRFSRSKLYGWVVKLLTHSIALCLVGLLASVFFLLPVAGFLEEGVQGLMTCALLVMILTEFVSIMDTSIKLNLPVPPVAARVVKGLQKRVDNNISHILGEREEAKKDREQ